MTENSLVNTKKVTRGRPPKGIESPHVWDDKDYKNEYFRSYYQRRKEKSELLVCECGCKIQSHYKYKHLNTKFHKNFMGMLKLCLGVDDETEKKV